MSTNADLRGYVARLLGWAREQAVDQALASIELATSRRAHLAVCGVGDLVPIAYALHRRTLGADRPFILCDPRRGNARASVRSPANADEGATAIMAAVGGTLCVRYARPPHDLASLAATIRTASDVQYVVCAGEESDHHPLLLRPAPIRLPSLQERVGELPRIVEEYATDALVELGARETCFTDHDRAWVLTHAATSLSEIEKTTLRLVALRASANMSNAAARLGMAPVSLSRWVSRRCLRRLLAAT